MSSSRRRPGTSAASGKWMNPIAIVWVVIICVSSSRCRTEPLGVPWDDAFDCEVCELRARSRSDSQSIVGVWWQVVARK